MKTKKVLALLLAVMMLFTALPLAASAAGEVKSITVGGQIGEPIVTPDPGDDTFQTWDFVVSPGTNLKNLKVNVALANAGLTLRNGTTVNGTLITAENLADGYNFSSPRTFTIANGTTKVGQLTINVRAAKDDVRIRSASAGGVTVTTKDGVNNTTKKVTITVPNNLDLTSVTPSFVLFDTNATIVPTGPQDFSNGPVKYTVIAEDGKTEQDYLVELVKNNGNANMLALNVTNYKQIGETVFTAREGASNIFDVEIVVENDAKLNQIIFDMDLSNGAYYEMISNVAAVKGAYSPILSKDLDVNLDNVLDVDTTLHIANFTNSVAKPIEYTVKSTIHTNEQNTYFVTIRKIGREAEIVSMTANGVTAKPDADKNIEFVFNSPVDLTRVAPAIEYKDVYATITPAPGEYVDFSKGPVTYTAVSEDGQKRVTYTVTMRNKNGEADVLAFDITGAQHPDETVPAAQVAPAVITEAGGVRIIAIPASSEYYENVKTVGNGIGTIDLSKVEYLLSEGAAFNMVAGAKYNKSTNQYVQVYTSDYNGAKQSFTVLSEDKSTEIVYHVVLERTYKVTVDTKVTNGKIIATPVNAIPGQEVEIVLSPDNGYALKEGTLKASFVNELSLTKLGENRYSFIMPAGDVLVTAEFEIPGEAKDYAVNVTSPNLVADKLTADEGEKVTISAKPGFELDAAPVVKNASGVVVPVTDNGDGTYSFTMPASDVTVTGTATEIPGETHNKYMNGYTDGSFRPQSNMTRAEVAAMIYNLMDSEDQGTAVTATFDDVKAGDWFNKAVGVLATKGIISGDGNGKFRPNDTISRAEFISIVVKYTEATLASEINLPYTDVKAGDWFYNAIRIAASKSWVSGYPGDTKFLPNNKITRAEVVSIMTKVLNRTPDEAFIDANLSAVKQFTDLDVVMAHWANYNIIEATNTHKYTANEDGSEGDWIVILP